VSKKISLFLATLFVGFHLYTAMFGVIPGNGQRAIHLLLILSLLFVNTFIKDEGKTGYRLVDLLFLTMSVLSVGYVLYISPTYDLRGGITYTQDVVFGIMLIITLLYATYKAIGPSLSIVAGVFILYAFLGMYAPSFLQHGGFRLSRFIHLIVYSSDGIFGSALTASANYIVLFIILGGVFAETGVGDYFTTLAAAAFGRFRGGPAKISVIASAFFGSISGSSIANVIGTGTFTIPLMKKMGFEPEYAGAVEATASTGGQIMPPIMGAAAFLVAEILQVSYFEVVKAAFIPALLYFTAVLLMIDLYARRKNLMGLDKRDIPDVMSLVKKVYLFLPLILLVILIGPMKMSITKAGIFTLIFTIVAVSLGKENRINKEKAIRAIKSSARGTIPVATACAIVGIIIGTVLGSGLGYRLSTLLVDIAGGKLPVLLLLTMVVSLILGMGLPTSAAYLVLATLVAPAVIKLGVDPMAAHLFIFYFGVISNVTPPVAMAAYAASGIARCSPNKCGFKAFKLALSGFILPFMFVYNPVLMARGTWYSILYCVGTALVGVYCLSSTCEGYFIKWNVSILERLLLGTAALMLICSTFITDIIGAGIFLGIFALKAIRSKNTLSPV
jgi:TRAP transporter 4TM/12TM fusion protein